MPRPKKIGGPEPKKRSRNGCWPCKARKVKCGEEKPQCLNCERQGEQCDYSIRLNWEGRSRKKDEDGPHKPTSLMDAFRSFPIESGLNGSSMSPATPTIATIEAQDHEIPAQQADNKAYHGDNSPSCEDDGRLSGNTRHLTPTTVPERFRSTTPNLRRTNSGERQLNFSPSAPGGMQMIDPALRPSSRPLQSPGRHEPIGVRYGSSESHLDHDHASNPSAGHPHGQQPFGSLLSNYSGQRNGYPSPSDSTQDSPGANKYRSSSDSVIKQHSGATASVMHTSASPPATNQAGTLTVQRGRERTVSPDPRAKRLKFSPTQSSFNSQNQRSPPHENLPSITSIGFGTKNDLQSDAQYGPRGLMNIRTPAASSEVSDDGHHGLPSTNAARSSALSPDLHRLSVNSLLSGPSVGERDLQSAYADSQYSSFYHVASQDGTVTYGLDRGFPDLDMGANDDANAINGILSPTAESNGEVLVQNHFGNGFYVPPEFGFGLRGKDTAFAKGGYYANPVPVKIPRCLEPLPHTLLANPMNLLYFHHFLNHTARVLVPHDCSENPFKTILPEMAVQDINLLNLLLAYSASHRARLLGQPEPANRIALWVQHVFPTLRHALDGSKEQISNVNLATAIMLASLEIISPNTFEVPVPWQNHLNTARRMIVARGGPESVHRKDKVSYFLSRWFAYLDVLGSLSGGKNDQPLFSGSYWANDDLDEENDFEIDCMLGFTSRCVSILAKIAELARQCDSERIDPNGTIQQYWRPSQKVTRAADKLQSDLQEARTHRFKGCNHSHKEAESETEKGWDSMEMIATNEAFHWAGLVHLHRRVYGKPSSDPQVQTAVREIVGLLFKVRKGGTAEACLLFPMFTAGCDAQDQGQREKILDRIKSIEQFGMTQVHKARTLMQKVWETGKPWETLVTGEFFG